MEWGPWEESLALQHCDWSQTWESEYVCLGVLASDRVCVCVFSTEEGVKTLSDFSMMTSWPLNRTVFAYVGCLITCMIC